MVHEKLSAFAQPVLRFGIVALFLWFGFSQLMSPGAWVSWVPQWAADLMPAQTIVLLNGGFETVFALALAAGFYTRIVALLLSLHLFFVAYEVGYNDIGVRDFALAVATLSLALFEPDQYTIDKRSKKE